MSSTTTPAAAGRTGALIAAATAALTLGTALSTTADARGMGGGGMHFGGMHFGGSSFTRSAPVKMQTFKLQSPSSSFKSSGIGKHTRRHVDVKETKPKILHVAPLKKHFEPKPKKILADKHRELIKKIVKHDGPMHLKRIKLDHDKAPKLVRMNKPPMDKAPKLVFGARHKIAAAAAAATVLKLKTQPVKLSPAQYLKAKVADDHGHKYDAQKKMWFDGRHWWRGFWAWLFIDGAWYYGNRPWIEADGGWTTDGPNAPVCVDCGGAAARVAEVAGGADKDGTNKDGGAKKAGGSESRLVSAQPAGGKPVKVDKVTFAKVASLTKDDAATPSKAPAAKPVETASLGLAPIACAEASPTPVVTPPAAEPGTGTVEPDLAGLGKPVTSVAEPAPAAPFGTGSAKSVAPSSVAPSSVAMATAGSPPAAPAADASGTAKATECRQFVPAIGMTIEVPCGD